MSDQGIAGPLAIELIDNTGVWVESISSDPSTTLALKNYSLGERAPAPDEQLQGPPGQYEYADFFPSPSLPYPSQAGLFWDEIVLNWDEIPDTWDQLT